jgi:hypothetical protein
MLKTSQGDIKCLEVYKANYILQEWKKKRTEGRKKEGKKNKERASRRSVGLFNDAFFLSTDSVHRPII